MNSVINLSTQLSAVDPSQGSSLDASAIKHTCLEGDCNTEGHAENDFLALLNAELLALNDEDSLESKALDVMQDIENIEEMDAQALPLTLQDVLRSIDTAEKTVDDIASTDELIDADALGLEVKQLLQQAIDDLPESVTALPLTSDNQQLIQQQVVNLFAQQNPEVVVKLEQWSGQSLPHTGNQLPKVMADLLANQSVASELAEEPLVGFKADMLSALNLVHKDKSAHTQPIIHDDSSSDLSDTGLSVKSLLSDSESEMDADFFNNKEKQTHDVLPVAHKVDSESTAQKFNLENMIKVTPLSSTAPSATAVNTPVSTTLSLPLNPSPEQWGGALGDKVQWMINSKLDSAELRIDPPHLGKMDVKIKMTDEGSSIIIQTQHLATKELVDSAVHRLKEMLQDAGHEQVNVDVSHKESHEQADSQFAQSDESHEHNESLNSSYAEQDGSLEQETGTVSEAFFESRPGLDLFA